MKSMGMPVKKWWQSMVAVEKFAGQLWKEKRINFNLDKFVLICCFFESFKKVSLFVEIDLTTLYDVHVDSKLWTQHL